MNLTPQQQSVLAEFKDLMGENVMNVDATDFKNIKPVPTVTVKTKEIGR